ncbi:MAG: diaminopimelate dehydrogenase [Clostridia bacterium]|nr:diaminopimelate dehydrogenase [Clostridia bacterium]
MSKKIRVGICGYGNLGKGVESEIPKSEDMELVAIFTRRNPETLETVSNVPVVSMNEMENWKDKIDVVIMCGGSATDLPVQVPATAKMFNTVDSFDTHAKIPEYYSSVDESAISANKTALISGGWDPGMFSIMRVYADSILSQGKTYTFWGKGVSQGHSDAIRRIEGVKDAKQYTIPIEEAMNKVRAGENPVLTTAQKHLRECFVVAEDGYDKKEIETKIKTMPNYFSDYDTTVHFISEEELRANHSKMAHGGFVIHSGETGNGNKDVIEYSLKLDSNPEFTASVLIALARATYRLNEEGKYGAKTVLDVPPAYLSKKSGEELRKELL